MFDYTPVGLGLAIMGIIFLRFGYRLLPRDRRAAPTLGEALDVRDYTTEASIGPESSLEGTTVAAFKADLEDVELTGLERDGEHRKKVAGQQLLKDGDTLMLKGQPERLARAIAFHGLLLAGKQNRKREGLGK